MSAAPTAAQLAQAHLVRGPGRVLAFYGQRRVVAAIESRVRVYVLQRQDRPLASWETVATARQPESAAQWLESASLPSTDAYARYTQRTAYLDGEDG